MPACRVAGIGRKELVYDFKNARHVVLQTRNIFEAINVQEVNNLTEALANGCKLTVIDIRATISAAKADRFMLVRPGSDYAFNLAVIHELLMQTALRRRIRRALDQGSRPAGRVRAPLHAGVGRGGNRHSRRRDPPVRARTRRRQTRRHLAPGLDDLALHGLVLRLPLDLHHQRAAGRDRRQGRAAVRQQTRRRRPQGAEETGRPGSQSPRKSGPTASAGATSTSTAGPAWRT